MNTENRENNQDELKRTADYLLTNDGYMEYNDEDLFNATYIFNHVLIDHIWTVNNKNMTQEEMEELGTKAGTAVRNLIKEFTNKDMHDVASNLLKK